MGNNKLKCLITQPEGSTVITHLFNAINLSGVFTNKIEVYTTTEDCNKPVVDFFKEKKSFGGFIDSPLTEQISFDYTSIIGYSSRSVDDILSISKVNSYIEVLTTHFINNLFAGFDSEPICYISNTNNTEYTNAFDAYLDNSTVDAYYTGDNVIGYKNINLEEAKELINKYGAERTLIHLDVMENGFGDLLQLVDKYFDAGISFVYDSSLTQRRLDNILEN